MFGTILMQKVVSVAMCIAALAGLPGCGTVSGNAEWKRPDAITGPVGDGAYMADIVGGSGHEPEDFFIFAASGTADFAYSGFKRGVLDMGEETDVFTFANSEQGGNLAFREREGYAHDMTAANEYAYNALRFFWN